MANIGDLQIKVLVDGFSQTKTQLNEISGSVKNVESASTGLQSKFRDLSVIAMGLFQSFLMVKQGLNDFLTTMKAGFEVDNMRKAFKGTAEELENLRKATAGTLTDGAIFGLTNQARDLGLSMNDVTMLISLAEDKTDEYGGTVENSFIKLLTATENGTKGLKSVGIQVAQYNEALQRLAHSQGLVTETIQDNTGETNINIKGLDAEEQKRLKIQAILDVSQYTMDKVNQKVQDNADKMEAWQVKTQMFGETFASALGSNAINVLENFVSAFQKADDKTKDSTESLQKWATILADILSFTAKHGSIIGVLVTYFNDLKLMVQGAGIMMNRFKDALSSNPNLSWVGSVISSLQWIQKEAQYAWQWMKNLFGSSNSGASGEWTEDPAHGGIPSKTTTGPTTGKGGKTSSDTITNKEKELNLLTLENEKLTDINKQIDANINNKGALIELELKREEILNRIYFLEKGSSTEFTKLDMSKYNVDTGGELTGYKSQGDGFIRQSPSKLLTMLLRPIGEMLTSSFDNIISSLRSVSMFFGEGANKFINSLIDGFNRVLSIVKAITSVMEAVSTVNSFIKMVSSVFGGGANLAGMNSVNLGSFANSNSFLNVNMPEVKLSGSDIYLSWRRQNKIETRRYS